MRTTGPVARAEQTTSAVTSATDDVKAITKAVAYGLRSTQSRPQTVAEITAKLNGRFDDGAVVAAAVEQLESLGALDDVTFARMWVEDRGHRRGYGLTRLRQELRRRQVPEDIAQAALASLGERDELMTASDLARRRAATLPAALEPAAVARRLHAYLVRRGYNQGLANKVAINVSGLARHREWD
ncbi:MAG: recombinase RecX [Nitriliruptorales bacterium]|nr:recombinase RecX [Nitriliruptorales bacterium]